jgi:hypothetical protein
MKETSFHRNVVAEDQFKIDYPYYGLFGSAIITPVYEEDEPTYRCRLLNGSTILLKKLFQTKKWIDAALNAETPLAAILGISIEDFLKIKKGA